MAKAKADKTSSKVSATTAGKAKTKNKKSTASTFKGKETNLVKRVTQKAVNSKMAAFGPGDTVNVYVKVIEGEKERVQLYKGVVTKIQGHAHKTFTVRKISAGVGVERTFPFNSPAIDSVELVSHGKVRRAKLYYLRGLEGKSARIESELASQESSSTK
ncbi:MAG: 50S ribosomal protein L19 [Bdellovibrio sp.]|nr:50S ribosomal protein L19 [Bdellovibrio sp.]